MVKKVFAVGVMIVAMVGCGTTEVKQAKDKNASLGVYVNYTGSLATMIQYRRFDWVNSDITEEHFPITKRSNNNVGMKLFYPNIRRISSYEVIQAMAMEGYRPAELPELLAYAKAYPDAQRKYIVALGSAWLAPTGGYFQPYLGGDGSEQYLNLHRCEGGWETGFHFLAVRK